MDKRYNSPGRRAIVAGLMAATILTNVAGVTKYAFASTPTAQIKTTNIDLSKLKLQKLNLNMNDYEVIHQDPTTKINSFDASEYYTRNNWAPSSIIQFSSQIDKSKDHIVIDNPLEVVFKNTGYYFGKQTNVRMKVNRVYYDAIDYSGTSFASTSTKAARMAKSEDEVMFAELDDAAGEKGLVQFTNYNFYTGEPGAAPYVHAKPGSKQNTLNSWYTMKADVTYTIEYADGTPADMKLVVPVGDIDVINWVNSHNGAAAGQNESFELPNADSQAAKIIFNNNFGAELTRPSDNNGTMVINPPTNSAGGNSADWIYNVTGTTIRSRSNALTFTSASADASGTDFGVFVEHPAVDPVKKVDKTRISSYKDGKLVYTIQSAIPKVGTDVIDSIDEFSIEDLLDNRLKNATVKGVYVTQSEDADPAVSDWRILPPTKYTIDESGQRLKVNIDKSQLGYKQVKVIFETDTLATDLTADTSVINNQATVHTDDVPSKSNVTHTQPTLKFDHEFVAEDGSQLPGDVTTLTPGTTEDITPGTTVTPNLFTVPDASKPNATYNGYDASKVQVKDDTKNGVWSFKTWDKASETLEKKNGHFIGTWAFTPNAYQQLYKYVMVDGSPVPAEVNATLPHTVSDLVDGTNVVAADPLAPAAANVMQPTDKGYDATKKQVKLPHGYANFTAWDIPTATINRANVLHTGAWEYHENLWGKSHEFKSNGDKALPAALTAITPASVSDQYHDGDVINADTFTIPTANEVPTTNPLYQAGKKQFMDEHGVWTADDAWDKHDVTVDHADTHFILGWNYQANTYNKSHSFESADGTALPAELTAITPASSGGYEDGTVLNADTFTVPDANKVDKSDKLYQEGKTQFKTNDGMGVWTAEPAWDKHDVTVDHADVHFVLKWSYQDYKYGKQHKFVAEDGSELPQGIKDITPANVESKYKHNEVITPDGFEVPTDKQPADNSEYKDATKKQFVDTERDGVWEFVNWDKANITVDHSDDNLFTGTWRFNPYHYGATYEFVSGTPGHDLPKSIVDMTPKDSSKYTTGTDVPANSEFTKTVEDKDADGTWTFKSYDYDKQTVNKADVHFVGTWEFTPNTYPVGYEFKSTDPKRELPKAVKDKLPKDDKKYVTKTPVDAQKIPNDPVYDPDLDIDWTFNKWDKPNKTIEHEGVKFTGEWTPKQREYKVTYKFTSGTPGKELPKEVTDLLPKDGNKYTNGTEVKSTKPSKTEVKVDGGTWKFKEFPPSLKIDKKDGEFAGEWVFEADPAPTPEAPAKPAKPAAKPVPKTGDATTVAPVVSGIAALVTSILAFLGIKRKSDE